MPGGDWDDDDKDQTAVSRVPALPAAVSAEGAPAGAMLVVLSGPAIGRNFALTEDRAIVGRAGDAHVPIPDTGVSRQHAELRREGAAWWLRDLRSTNGTTLNGRAVGEAAALRDGDRIGVGERTLLKFTLLDSLEAEVQRRLSDAVYRDALTGVFNRRYLDQRLAEELAFAFRHGRALSLLVVDVDHFKRVNDTHGHQAGDEALRALAQCLDHNVRREDVVARFGGEEFVILARGISLEQARLFGERVRGFVSKLRVPLREGELTFTVSIGCATYHTDETVEPDTPATLFERADAALYEAKQAGRDRVAVRT